MGIQRPKQHPVIKQMFRGLPNPVDVSKFNLAADEPNGARDLTGKRHFGLKSFKS